MSNNLNNIIKKMRKEWKKQNEELKKFTEKEIDFAACYHEGFKDGIEKCYKYLEEEFKTN